MVYTFHRKCQVFIVPQFNFGTPRTVYLEQQFGQDDTYIGKCSMIGEIDWRSRPCKHFSRIDLYLELKFEIFKHHSVAKSYTWHQGLTKLRKYKIPADLLNWVAPFLCILAVCFSPFLGGAPTSVCHFFHHAAYLSVHHLIIIFGTHM